MSRAEQMLAEVRALHERQDVRAIVARFGDLETRPEAWSSWELLFEVARAYGLLGDEAKVERYLRRCAELYPRRAALFHCQLGWCYQRKRKWTTALRWYEEAERSFPTYQLCLFRKGYCLYKLGRVEEAARTLARAAELWRAGPPEQQARGRRAHIQVLFHLARALRDLGDLAGARATLAQSAALDDGDPPVIRPEHRQASLGEICLREGDFAGARAAFQRARDIDPRSSYFWERLGQSCEQLGLLAEAEQAYLHAVRLPRGGAAHLSLGRFYLNATRDIPRAWQRLQEGLRRDREHEAELQVQLARCELALARPAAGLARLERAIELGAGRNSPELVEAHRLAAEICRAHGELERLHHHLEQLVALAPDENARRLELERVEESLRDPSWQERRRPMEDAPLPAELNPPREPPGAGRPRCEGSVSCYFPDRGFGFISFGTGQSIFFHISRCERPDPALYRPGARVSFVVGHNPRRGKPQAEQVRFLR